VTAHPIIGRSAEDHDVLHTVRTVLAEMIPVDVAVVERGSALVELGAQSLDFVELVVRLEREYGIEIPRTYAIPNEYKVEDYVQAVTRQLRARV